MSEPTLLLPGSITGGWQGFIVFDLEREWRRLHGQPLGEVHLRTLSRETFEMALKPHMRMESFEAWPHNNYGLAMEMVDTWDVWTELRKNVARVLSHSRMVVISGRGGGWLPYLREGCDLSTLTDVEFCLRGLSPEGEEYLRGLDRQRLKHVLAVVYLLTEPDKQVHIVDVQALHYQRLVLRVVTNLGNKARDGIQQRIPAWRKHFSLVMAISELSDGVLERTREYKEFVGLDLPRGSVWVSGKSK